MKTLRTGPVFTGAGPEGLGVNVPRPKAYTPDQSRQNALLSCGLGYGVFIHT